MTKIKICGLMTLADIEAVNHVKPDLAGFIFAKGRHQITLDQAIKMRQRLDSSIKSVGVFVNASLTEMLAAVKSQAVSMIQLHGQEDESIVKKLQEQSIPVINVFKPNFQHPTSADFVMIDSGAGNGKLIDWQKISIQVNQPFFIAGDLNIENIQNAITETNPDFVDLSRGVETNGIKDPQKISEIVKLVHSL